LSHGAEQLTGPHTEVDPRQASVGQAGQHPRRMWKHELPVLTFGQRARPRVEQLNRIHPGGGLNAKEGQGELSEPSQQGVPDVGLGMHECLGALVVAARSALDKIGRKSEWGPSKADQRDLPQLGDQQPHRGGHRLHSIGFEHPQPRDISGAAHRTVHHRTSARHDVQPDASGMQRHHDVAEQDRGVHAVPAHGLQRDLAGQLRSHAGLQHRLVSSQLAVLGQRPTTVRRRVAGDRWPAQ
jgi:hypothetical protein